MLKVVLTSFFFIISAALHIVLLLGQLVFCTYSLFGTLKIHYRNVRVVMAFDSGSDVRGFSPLTDDLCFSVPDIFLIFMIFSSSCYFINRVIDFIYIFNNRKLYQPPLK